MQFNWSILSCHSVNNELLFHTWGWKRMGRSHPLPKKNPWIICFWWIHGGEISPEPLVDSNEKILEWVRKDGETAYHPSCSCAMGTGTWPEMDTKSFKVHNMEGIRVVDASAMPCISDANINAPTLMLAEKAADIILQNTPLSQQVQEFYRTWSEFNFDWVRD